MPVPEDPFCHLGDKPRAPKHERTEGAVRRASTNTAGVPLKSAVRRPSLAVSCSAFAVSLSLPHVVTSHRCVLLAASLQGCHSDVAAEALLQDVCLCRSPLKQHWRHALCPGTQSTLSAQQQNGYQRPRRAEAQPVGAVATLRLTLLQV